MLLLCLLSDERNSGTERFKSSPGARSRPVAGPGVKSRRSSCRIYILDREVGHGLSCLASAVGFLAEFALKLLIMLSCHRDVF